VQPIGHVTISSANRRADAAKPTLAIDGSNPVTRKILTPRRKLALLAPEHNDGGIAAFDDNL